MSWQPPRHPNVQVGVRVRIRVRVRVPWYAVEIRGGFGGMPWKMPWKVLPQVVPRQASACNVHPPHVVHEPTQTTNCCMMHAMVTHAAFHGKVPCGLFPMAVS